MLATSQSWLNSGRENPMASVRVMESYFLAKLYTMEDFLEGRSRY